MRQPCAIILAFFTALACAACEKVTEDNLNKWMTTKKGPEKIREALEDPELDFGLRAVAARNMIRRDQWVKVKEILEETPEDQRVPLIEALVPKLWEDARLEKRLARPLARQVQAKDALFELRQYTNEEGRKAIDDYLIEWLSGYYEGRSASGRISGHVMVRAIGPRAAEGLLSEARSIVAAAASDEGDRGKKVGDNLLYGLALSGSPKAVGFVLDLAAAPAKDKTLQDRAMAALFNAYVKPTGVEPADPEALEPHAERLNQIILDSNQPGAVRNDAIQLVAVLGMPDCLPVFVNMVSYPSQTESFRWVGVQQGIRCGGIDAIVPVAEALPPGSYERGVLKKYFWDEVEPLSPRGKVVEKAEQLLGSDSPWARISGVELLGMVKLKSRAAETAEKVRRLAGDRTVLEGWWGDSKTAKGKKDPTIGSRAAEVAAELEQMGR